MGEYQSASGDGAVSSRFTRPGSKEVEEGRIIERIVQLPGQTVQAAWQRPVAPNGMGTPNVNQNRPQTQ